MDKSLQNISKHFKIYHVEMYDESSKEITLYIGEVVLISFTENEAIDLAYRELKLHSPTNLKKSDVGFKVMNIGCAFKNDREHVICRTPFIVQK